MASSDLPAAAAEALRQGVVLPAMPLALTAERRFDERRQRGLCRYYFAAGAGGLAAGVHTTQFAIREPHHNLLQPVLDLVREEFDRDQAATGRALIRVAGVCGRTAQAAAEAELARDLGYHAGLLNLGALADATDDELLAHCRTVAAVLPLFGFYLNPNIGGRVLNYRFWCGFAEIERVLAIKIAPFNRYQTFDVVRAIAEAGRDDIALYTGNDDQILLDLITPFRIQTAGRTVERRIVGGLLGQWAVWTRRAVEMLEECHALARTGAAVPADMLRRAWELTDANAAVFDAANDFAGCIPGVSEVLRRQGLFESTWCLDVPMTLSPGQAEELDRVCRAYPHLSDDDFVAQHRDEWLRG